MGNLKADCSRGPAGAIRSFGWLQFTILFCLSLFSRVCVSERLVLPYRPFVRVFVGQCATIDAHQSVSFVLRLSKLPLKEAMKDAASAITTHRWVMDIRFISVSQPAVRAPLRAAQINFRCSKHCVLMKQMTK